jgi:cellulose synthase/poly-beta-1,6-N-acetylglucosamine synthase-like glycosyltransferase
VIGRIGAAAFAAGFGYAALARLGVLLPALRPGPGQAPSDGGHGGSVTFLVPAREEHLTVGRTLRRLLAHTPDGVRVLAVVDVGDPRTVRAAEDADDGSCRLRVVRDTSTGGKGAALTAALPLVDSEVVGVFDADSVVQPGLLGPVARAFADGADVVQVPVRPRWHRAGGWHGTRTLLDYASWTRGRAGTTTSVVRLSGTGVFFRTDLVRAIGGWRPSLTEDFDLALRLTAAGARVTVVDVPRIATDEEVPLSARDLLRQRTRWHQGFLEILSAGAWYRLPTARMRAAAAGPLLVPAGRALAVVGMVLVLVAVLTGGPPPPTVVVVPTAALAVLVLAVDAVVFSRIGPDYGVPVSVDRLVELVLGAVPFYAVSGAASALAVARQLAGRHVWETTAHGRAE